MALDFHWVLTFKASEWMRAPYLFGQRVRTAGGVNPLGRWPRRGLERAAVARRFDGAALSHRIRDIFVGLKPDLENLFSS